jgi:hypothetical protein
VPPRADIRFSARFTPHTNCSTGTPLPQSPVGYAHGHVLSSPSSTPTAGPNIGDSRSRRLAAPETRRLKSLESAPRRDSSTCLLPGVETYGHSGGQAGAPADDDHVPWSRLPSPPGVASVPLTGHSPGRPGSGRPESRSRNGPRPGSGPKGQQGESVVDKIGGMRKKRVGAALTAGADTIEA